MSDGFVMPFSEDAERHALGIAFLDSEPFLIAAEELRPEMFYVGKYRQLWTAMLAIGEAGSTPDPVAASEWLRAHGQGGTITVTEIASLLPNDFFSLSLDGDVLRNHIETIRGCHMRRRVLETAREAIAEACEPGSFSPGEIVDRAAQRLYEIDAGAERRGPRLVHGRLMDVFEDIERRQRLAESGDIPGLRTGLADLDEMTGGFHPGDLVVLAARPSMGKTGLAIGHLLEATIRQRCAALFFSMEMSETQILLRMLAQEANVDLARLIRGQKLEPEDYVSLTTAAGPLNDAPLLIDDRGTQTVASIRNAVRRASREHELGLVVVDYLQLMDGSGQENRQQEVSAISRGLKQVAKDFEVPLIALSQLSRAPEQRQNHRPTLSDLRESGAIEQDADLVAFLFRPEYYLTASEVQEQRLEGHAELIVGKQRNGPTDTISMYFRKECARFEDRAPDWREGFNVA